MNFEPVKSSSLHYSRLLIIKSLLEGYDGSQPFAAYLKSCFQKNKNYGSRDRKLYASWCYAFFRLGKALPNMEINDRLCIAWYLVHGPGDEIFNLLNSDALIPADRLIANDRIQQITELFPAFQLADIFPFDFELSGGLTAPAYAKSMLVQPRVWIRIISGKENEVFEELQSNDIPFNNDIVTTSAVSLEPGVKLDGLVTKQKGYFEIQDRSSQIAGAAIPALTGEHWWDCCCGAGGKSLELFDKVPGIRITATDSRASILKNYRERTEKYHAQLATTVLDLEQPVAQNFFGNRFDGIIADVPCSGSGTWSRTPENLQIFKDAVLAGYVTRQKAIITASISFLKSKGRLAYITCSVFKAENEEMAAWIASLPGMSLQVEKFIDGWGEKADSMYYSIFVKD